MTVWIYTDTSKQVGDPDHLKAFANKDAANEWFKQHDPEGVAFEYPVKELRQCLPRSMRPRIAANRPIHMRMVIAHLPLRCVPPDYSKGVNELQTTFSLWG